MQMLILGMHRSGTSMATKIIEMMGVSLGKEGNFGDNEDNPRGFWEREDVAKCNALLLRAFDPAWHKLNFSKWLADWIKKEPEYTHEQLSEKIKSIIRLMNAQKQWAIKDPQMCLTLKYWSPMLGNPLCIILSRNPLESVSSLMIRKYDKFTSDELGLALWEYHAVGIIKNAAQLPKVFVRHEELMADPVNTTANLYDDLFARNVEGITLPSREQILEFIDPSLYRAKDDGSRTLTPHQQRLYAMLRGEEEFDTSVELSEESKHIMLSK